jgi:uncharacterized protein
MAQELKDGPAILRETFNHLERSLGDQINTLSIERAVLGLFFSGVKLSNGFGGLCFTPIKDIPEAVCCPSHLKAMPNSGKLVGTQVQELLEDMFENSNPLKRTLGIAVMNALSNTLWNSDMPRDYQVISGVDPVDTLQIADDANVVVVGALVPYIRLLKKRGKPFWVLEQDPRTLKPDEMPFYAPPEKAAEKVPQADILIITGTTIINDTLERLLDLAKPSAEIVLVGPTASMLPEAFFSRGVSVLGGVMVTKADELLNIISEAGSGYHFFGKSAEKITISPNK